MNQQQYRRMRVVQKVEVFKGLEAKELQRLLRACFFQSFQALQRIYTVDGPSEDMLILLKGQLIVTGKSGEVLGEVLPGMSTGEMGLFTGRPRSANVTTSVESSGLLVRKENLEILFQEDRKIHNKVLQNVVAILTKLIVKSNVQIEDYARTIHEMREEVKSISRTGETREEKR